MVPLMQSVHYMQRAHHISSSSCVLTTPYQIHVERLAHGRDNEAVRALALSHQRDMVAADTYGAVGPEDLARTGSWRSSTRSRYGSHDLLSSIW